MRKEVEALLHRVGSDLEISYRKLDAEDAFTSSMGEFYRLGTKRPLFKVPIFSLAKEVFLKYSPFTGNVFVLQPKRPRCGTSRRRRSRSTRAGAFRK